MAKKSIKIEFEAYCRCSIIQGGDPIKMKAKQTDKETVSFKCPICKCAVDVLICEISIEEERGRR